MGIADTILSLLGDAEVHCSKAFPNGKMPALEEPVVMVSTKQIQFTPCAISHHFGLSGDDVSRVVLCEEEVLLDVYSPYLWGGKFCDRTTDNILNLVLSSIMDYTFKNVRRGQSYYDPETDCYRNEICVAALAWIRFLEE